MNHDAHDVSGHPGRGSLERLGDALLEYLRTRTSEHWVMFLAGLAVGLVLG